MDKAIVITGRLVNPTTVELDEPVPDMLGPVEVFLRLAVAGKIDKGKGQTLPLSTVPLPEEKVFWQEKTLDELAAEQGLRLPQSLDRLIGRGQDLWESDEEFEEFLRALTACRHPER